MNFNDRNIAIKKILEEMRIVYQRSFSEYLNHDEKIEQLKELNNLHKKLIELKKNKSKQSKNLTP
jgi:hypothetical protein